MKGVKQLLGVKTYRTEHLGSRKNTDGGKRRPWTFRMGRETSSMDVLHVAGLVVVIGLVYMTTEIKVPRLQMRPYGTHVRRADSGEEDPDGELIEDGILEVAVLENSPLQGHRTRGSVFWHISPSV